MSYLGNKAKSVLRRYLRRKHRINTAVKTNATLPRVIMAKSNLYVQAQVVEIKKRLVRQKQKELLMQVKILLNPYKGLV